MPIGRPRKRDRVAAPPTSLLGASFEIESYLDRIAWSPDGRHIAFTARREDEAVLDDVGQLADVAREALLNKDPQRIRADAVDRLAAAGAGDSCMVGASVDLSGLHMASDHDFNRKSFTTGHSGFSMPFTTWPDRADVPRNAARALRYMDRFVTVTQGEVFYITQVLAELEIPTVAAIAPIMKVVGAPRMATASRSRPRLSVPRGCSGTPGWPRQFSKPTGGSR